MTESNMHDIQWETSDFYCDGNGLQLRHISAESFVRLWQTSQSAVDFQSKICEWIKSSTLIASHLKTCKERLADTVQRLEAFKQKDAHSTYLDEKDVAALTGEKYKSVSWARGGVICPDERQFSIEDDITTLHELVVKLENLLEEPLHSQLVPTTSALQGRAKRFREKCVRLKTLPRDHAPPGPNKWEALAELADELIAA